MINKESLIEWLENQERLYLKSSLQSTFDGQRVGAYTECQKAKLYRDIVIRIERGDYE